MAKRIALKDMRYVRIQPFGFASVLWAVGRSRPRPTTDFRATQKAGILLSYASQHDSALQKTLRGNCHAQ